MERGSAMSDRSAAKLYFWSKVRQALKNGACGSAMRHLTDAEREHDGLGHELMAKAAETFTAGCAALGDPAPLDKGNDNG
jgi:hypothetical protein